MTGLDESVNDVGQRARARPVSARQDWARPEDEPILDAARVPLERYPDTPHSYVMYVWLRFARPLLVIVFWAGVGLYACRNFFQTTVKGMDGAGLLGLYVLIVLGIFISMLFVAILRRTAREEDADLPGQGGEMALVVAPARKNLLQRLIQWRQARRLAVLHDRQGRLRKAKDLDRMGQALQELDGAGPDRRG